MEHEKAQTLLSDYLEGELGPGVASELDQHLSNCSECKSDLASLQKLMGLVRKMPRAKVPDNFARKVRSRALRAGLWGAASVRSSQRMPAPFAKMWTTWGLMLALGMILSFVFIAQQQIVLLTAQGQVVVTVHSSGEIGAIQSLARQLNLKVSATKGSENGLIVLVPKDRWMQLYQGIIKLGLRNRFPAAPAPDQKGIIHLLILNSSEG